jgi:DNA repair protein RecN (Recombination protein N)
MLDRLSVDNLVLIRSAELELAPGLNVITGETGAGKTIVTQAVGLLLGGRADDALVGPASGEAYVEAAFVDVADETLPEALRDLAPEDAEELVLARRVVADGRSRALAWGRSCARGDLEEAGGALLEVVSQHEARRLTRPAVQLDLLDAAAGEHALEARGAMVAAWRDLVAARERAEAAAGAEAGRLRAIAEAEALVEALDAAGLAPGEDDELRSERARLRHVDELYAAAAGAAERINPEEGTGALGLVGEAVRAVEDASELDSSLSESATALAEAQGVLQEAARELRRYADSLEAEPGRLEVVESRLELLSDLLRRFDAPALPELLGRGDAARALLGVEQGQPPLADRLAGELAAAEAAADAAATRLRDLREAAAEPFCRAVEQHLADLGMAAARLEVVLERRELGPRGADAAALLLQANPGLPAAPAGSAASGGELSRLALAIRLAARDEGSPQTLVFDEVDAGIGGVTARALGEKLRGLSISSQIVCITHLPQIAALADRHFRVVKELAEQSETRIERLDGDDVVAELVRMLGADAGDQDATALAISMRADRAHRDRQRR